MRSDKTSFRTKQQFWFLIHLNHSYVKIQVSIIANTKEFKIWQTTFTVASRCNSFSLPELFTKDKTKNNMSFLWDIKPLTPHWTAWGGVWVGGSEWGKEKWAWIWKQLLLFTFPPDHFSPGEEQRHASRIHEATSKANYSRAKESELRQEFNESRVGVTALTDSTKGRQPGREKW